jgi:hypothetical protein
MSKQMGNYVLACSDFNLDANNCKNINNESEASNENSFHKNVLVINTRL